MTTTEWVVDGLCGQTDPEAFFPAKGGSTRAAKWICRRCPVQADCLTWAIETNQTHGVWGGTSGQERRAIRRTGRRNGQ